MPFSDVEACIEPPAGVLSPRAALYWRQEYGVWKKIGEYAEAKKVILPDLAVGYRYEVAVAAVDGEGNPAEGRDWVIEPITPQGSTTAPPTPTNFAVVQDGEWLVAEWDDVSDQMRDFLQYEIRVGSSWIESVRITQVLKPTHRWKWSTTGAQTYRLCTIDKYGKRSTETTCAVTVKDLQGFVDGTETDEDGGSFGGTKDGCSVDSGDLIFDRWGNPANTATEMGEDATWLPWGPREATYESAEVDLGSARNVRIELNLAATTDGDFADRMGQDANLPPRVPVADEEGNPIDRTDEDAALEIGQCVAAGDERPIDILAEIKFGTSSPISGSYQRYVPGFYYGRYFRMRWTLRSWDRYRRPRIATLRWKERKRNLKDEGVQAVVADPGPTVITFAQTFIDTPTVVCTLDDAGSGAYVEITAISTTTATLRVYGTDGVEVFDGNVYWIAAGT